MAALAAFRPALRDVSRRDLPRRQLLASARNSRSLSSRFVPQSGTFRAETSRTVGCWGARRTPGGSRCVSARSAGCSATRPRLEGLREEGGTVAPSTGIEPVACRLGGDRSIRLSYEGRATSLGRTPRSPACSCRPRRSSDRPRGCLTGRRRSDVGGRRLFGVGRAGAWEVSTGWVSADEVDPVERTAEGGDLVGE